LIGLIQTKCLIFGLQTILAHSEDPITAGTKLGNRFTQQSNLIISPVQYVAYYFDNRWS